MARLHRIYLNQDIELQQSIRLPEDAGHYLSRVLRARTGQLVVVFNGNGLDFKAEIESLDRGNVILRILDKQPVNTESPLKITLVQAISRGERMDVTLQKATELGVLAFKPVFTTRTEVRLTEKKIQKRMLHWKKVIISASEQCGRGRIPALSQPVDVMTWAQQKTDLTRIMLVPGADAKLSSVLPVTKLELLIGPEGGLDEKEVELLGRQDIIPVSLGPRILRTETAGPAATAMLQAMAGDMG